MRRRAVPGQGGNLSTLGRFGCSVRLTRLATAITITFRSSRNQGYQPKFGVNGI
jgi:hypothetical protein